MEAANRTLPRFRLSMPDNTAVCRMKPDGSFTLLALSDNVRALLELTRADSLRAAEGRGPAGAAAAGLRAGSAFCARFRTAGGSGGSGWVFIRAYIGSRVGDLLFLRFSSL